MSIFSETIVLEDKVSDPAKKAALAMKTLSSALASTERGLIKAGALGQSSKFDKLSKDADMLKASIDGIDKSLLSTSSSSSVADASLFSIEAIATLAVAAIASLAVGFAALTVAGAKFAIEATEIRAKMVSVFDALGSGKVSGDETVAMLERLSAATGITRDHLGEFAKTLVALGVEEGPALEKATLANASAFALMGDKGAAAFQKVMKQTSLFLADAGKLKNPLKAFSELGLGQGQDVAAAMGISVGMLAKQIKAGTVNAKQFGDALQDALIKRGAGPIEKLSNSFGSIKDMFIQNITKMFEIPAVEGFMAQVKSLFSIFDSDAKPSGQALKVGIGGFFTEVFSAATKLVPLVKSFMLDMIIYGLKAYIALQPIKKWFDDITSNQATMDTIVTGFKLIGYAVAGATIVIGGLVGTVGFLAYGFISGAVGIYKMGAAIVDFVGGAALALAGWLSGAEDMAWNFVSGLVNGISNGAGALVESVKGLVKRAIGAWNDESKSHSPSRVGFEIGGQLPKGITLGIEDGEDEVHASAKGVARAAISGSSSKSKEMVATPYKSSNSISVMVHIEGAGKSAMEITEEMVSMVFERMALEAGV